MTARQLAALVPAALAVIVIAHTVWRASRYVPSWTGTLGEDEWLRNRMIAVGVLFFMAGCLAYL